MKIFFSLCIILFFILSWCTLSRINTQENTSIDTKSEVSHILAHQQKIKTQLSNYQILEFDIREKSSEWWGAKVFFWWDENMINMIETEYLWETGKRKIEYILKNEKVVLITDEYHSYNMPIYWSENLLWEENNNYPEEDFFWWNKNASNYS